MKEWKEELVKALGKKAESEREIKFRDVANECGYNHVKTQEVKEIAKAFLKEHPTYKAVQMVENPERVSATESLFTTLVLTELEYQSKEEFFEEMGMKYHIHYNTGAGDKEVLGTQLYREHLIRY